MSSQHSSIRMWSLLHLAIGISAIVVLATTSGCDELTLKEKAPDIGKESSLESVQDAIAQALDGVYYSDLRAGDGAFYENNYRIETSAPVSASTLEETVTQRLNCGTSTRLILQETFTDYTQKPTIPTISSRYIDFPRVAGTELESTFLNSLKPPQLLWASQSLTMPLADEVKQTLHNLKVAPITIPVPQAQPDCDRFEDCKVGGTEIRVDIVTWKNPKKPTVAKIVWRVSREIHALAATLSQCRSELMDIQGRNYYVNQCEVLRDFWFGDPTAPDQPGTPELCPK